MRKAVECVTAGHPDKVCDQIADAIVDEYLRRDSEACVNVNVLGASGMFMVGGVISSSADFDIAALAQQVYADAGYSDEVQVFANIEPIHASWKKGMKSASDTVVVTGYATRETRERLPRPLVFASHLARRLDDVRRTDPSFSWLLPDGKVQVVMDKERVSAVTVVVAHKENIDVNEVRTAIVDRVVGPVVGNDAPQLYVNPLGAFTTCGFVACAGASGRKLAGDTYGGLVPFGDSVLSGKDPSRAERAGAYMARCAARWLVDQELASSAVVTVAYAVGRAEPVLLEAAGVSDKSRGAKMDYAALLRAQFDFRPEAIVERLGLRKPMYRASSVYGQFGRPGFPWEETVS